MVGGDRSLRRACQVLMSARYTARRRRPPVRAPVPYGCCSAAVGVLVINGRSCLFWRALSVLYGWISIFLPGQFRVARPDFIWEGVGRVKGSSVAVTNSLRCSVWFGHLAPCPLHVGVTNVRRYSVILEWHGEGKGEIHAMCRECCFYQNSSHNVFFCIIYS